MLFQRSEVVATASIKARARTASIADGDLEKGVQLRMLRDSATH